MARRFDLARWVRGAGIAASLFLLGCPGGEAIPEDENTAAACSDGKDNDLDGSADCFDIECQPFGCQQAEDEICTGGLDEDEDGLIDCEDVQDCDGNPACVEGENCSNNQDDDGDGATDCDDAGCSQNPQCTGNGGNGGEGGGPSANCLDGEDNDNDGDANCDDSECTDECNGANTPENCTNGVDDNFDGRIDCADPQCFNSDPNCIANGNGEGGPGTCFDGLDNDNNGAADCSDFQCFNDPLCGGGGGGFFEVCGDGIDNNGDGLADCDDFTCLIDPTAGCLPEPGECNPNGTDPLLCALGLDPQCLCGSDFNCLFFDPCCGDPNSFECTGIAPPEVCNNNTDDDFDGAADCNDSDCAAFPACIVEICDNGIDDNSDGQPDCRDVDCANSPLCVEVCLDGQDNDNDGQVDCADAGCVGSADCTETGAECADGQDNDQDGQSDCADVNCFGDAACVETGAECADGNDNDNDNAVDCADADCNGDAACLCGVVAPAQLGANSGTTAGGDDFSAGSCQIAFNGGDGADVAFSLTAPASGLLRFELSSATDQGIYLQTTCANSGSEVGCADDFITNDEGLVIPATGQTLSAIVGAFQAGDEGPFTLTIFADNGTGICAAPFTAINKATAPGANNAGNNTGAPNIAEGSCVQGGNGGPDVVFQFTPTATTANLTLFSGDDMVLFVRGANCGNGAELGCADNLGVSQNPETLNLTGLTVGTPIFIFVGGFTTGDVGPFNLFIQ